MSYVDMCDQCFHHINMNWEHIFLSLFALSYTVTTAIKLCKQLFCPSMIQITDRKINENLMIFCIFTFIIISILFYIGPVQLDNPFTFL